METIVHSDSPVTLLGGGPANAAMIAAALALAPRLVAADGGADAALAAGHPPEAVIGDMDSLSPAARARLPKAVLHEIAEQDSTDFDKARRAIDAPLVIGVGFMGRRMDHGLAALSALVARPDPPCILLGKRDLVFACPPFRQIALDLVPGTRLSLFPMAPVTGRSEGLRWPIAGLSFAPGGQIGTSNAVTGPVRLTMDGPGMLCLIPPGALVAARDALLPGPATAPPARR